MLNHNSVHCTDATPRIAQISSPWHDMITTVQLGDLACQTYTRRFSAVEGGGGTLSLGQVLPLAQLRV